jgi:acetyl-CoA carboxylase carboxyl transferase subunit beta
MKFGNFSLFNKEETNSNRNEEDISKFWLKCPSCKSTMYYKEIQKKDNVCPKCNFHMKMNVQERINLMADKDSFIEHDNNLKPNDPIDFMDIKSYKKRLKDLKEKINKTSSIISGTCTIGGELTEMVVFNFAFMGGSMGSVEGEKIVRATKRAINNRSGLLIISTSGGARMQESTFALMQMAKTSAILKTFSDHKLPFISLLTDPTMGGVSASFAMLGDIILAEPGAIIGFAGARVIKQTIGENLPEGFQTSEFLLEKGAIDMVVPRSEIKKTISDLFKLLKGNE